VKKQPNLTNFPTYILATAKRKAQAQLRVFRTQIVRGSLCGYGVMFQKVLPSMFLEQIDDTRRKRHYSSVAVFWAWLNQILECNASCSKAVSLIQVWSRELGLPEPSSDTGAYCKARQRVSTEFLNAIDEKVQAHLEANISKRNLWRGHQLLAIDGTSVTLMDTEDNQEQYPQPSGQKAGCGFPVMGIVGMVNLSHGGIIEAKACPHTTHDSKVALHMLESIGEGDIVLGDRAFCSYQYITRIAHEGKGHSIMRLHQKRHGKLDWRRGKKLSSYERIVT